MKRQIVVIGLGRFGISLASTLSFVGHDVLAIERDEDTVQKVASQVTHAVQADATDESVLKELGITNFEIAIVAIGSEIESSVLSTILLKKLELKRVIARANNNLHGSILEKIGADSVVYPEHEMGVRIAHRVSLVDISDYMTVVPGYGIAKLRALPAMVDKSLAQIGFGQGGKYDIATLLLQREKEVIVNPGQREIIKANDNIIVSGSDEKLAKMLAEVEETKKDD